jgi:hypothetical protein
MSQREARSYQWAIGILVSLLLLLVGLVWGSASVAQTIGSDLKAHESLVHHPVGAAYYLGQERRLDRIEQSLQRVEQKLEIPLPLCR